MKQSHKYIVTDCINAVKRARGEERFSKGNSKISRMSRSKQGEEVVYHSKKMRVCISNTGSGLSKGP